MWGRLCMGCLRKAIKFMPFFKSIVLNIILSLEVFHLQAQCPPPGFPSAGESFELAPMICEDLNGYCNSYINRLKQKPFYGCDGQVLGTYGWIGFVAASTSISIRVAPKNCSEEKGLRGALYSLSDVLNPIGRPQCDPSQEPFELSWKNFEVCQLSKVSV